ncbi:hypothetical protein [Acetobacter indonesiensis]|uniref:hypothetical protein n=1 Tax=Acetobacter indonesiensis TaxID=104101 RepID=UPI0011775404|nr:hypothetical protein [Acetobacter indonesiensis]
MAKRAGYGGRLMDHAQPQSVSPPTVSHPSLSDPSMSHTCVSHTIMPHSTPRASAPLSSSGLSSASAPPAVTAAHRGSYKPAPPALRAVFAARAAGVALTPRDMPPALVAHLHQHWAQVQVAMRPVSELHVAAWLKKLSLLVTNPPGADTAAAQCRAMFDVCQDIPAGAWCPDARLAWARQPPRNGYPTGARWPSPNELRTILLPFAQRIQQDAAGCRALLAFFPVAEPPVTRPVSALSGAASGAASSVPFGAPSSGHPAP